jgi:hypothetical protein
MLVYVFFNLVIDFLVANEILQIFWMSGLSVEGLVQWLKLQIIVTSPFA